MIQYAVHQPNFLPWTGYYAKLFASQLFVYLDDAQLPGGASYVTRTRVAGANDPAWLSVSIVRNFGQKIVDTELNANPWREKIANVIANRYHKYPFLDVVRHVIEPVTDGEISNLAELNSAMIARVMQLLDIERKTFRSSALSVDSTSDQRLAEIGKAIGADRYLSGKGGFNYQEPETFTDAGISLAMIDPSDNLDTLQDEFGLDPRLSIIEALATLGPPRTRELVAKMADTSVTKVTG